MRRPNTAMGVALAFAGAAAAWSVLAAWLCANLYISVLIELTSYWVCLLLTLAAWLSYLWTPRILASGLSGCFRFLAMSCSAVLVVAAWLFSNSAFFYWKMKAIPQRDWPRLVSDLQSLGRHATETGVPVMMGKRQPIPRSLHQLGLGYDYIGAGGQLFESDEYTGVVADVEFGVKVRRWGLYVGPKSRLEERWRGCLHARVGTNAYFFVGPRG